MILYVKLVPFGFYQIDKIEILKDLVPGIERVYQQYRVDNEERPLYDLFGEDFKGRSELLSFVSNSIFNFFDQISIKEDSCYIHTWVNVHSGEGHYGWHTHEYADFTAHMTIQAKKSQTLYFDQVTMALPSQPGLLTVIGNNQISHSTTIESDPNAIRITIASDIFLKCPQKLKKHVTLIQR